MKKYSGTYSGVPRVEGLTLVTHSPIGLKRHSHV